MIRSPDGTSGGGREGVVSGRRPRRREVIDLDGVCRRSGWVMGTDPVFLSSETETGLGASEDTMIAETGCKRGGHSGQAITSLQGHVLEFLPIFPLPFRRQSHQSVSYHALVRGRPPTPPITWVSLQDDAVTHVLLVASDLP